MVLTVRSNKGFSLVELMIALFILAFSLLGFLGVMASSIDSNIKNELRNTGIALTTQVAETLLAQDFDNLAASSSCSLTPHSSSNTCLVSDYTMYPDPGVITVRGLTAPIYTVTWSITDLNTNLKEIELTLNYTYRGENFSYQTVVYKHKGL